MLTRVVLGSSQSVRCYRLACPGFCVHLPKHLRIKSFFGTSENAVKTQIWIAVSMYVLVAIIRKRLNIKASLYSILQILSLTNFETRGMVESGVWSS
jgi:hypothetical protein